MSQTPNLLNSADACRELVIDRSTLSRWVSSGRITPAYKMPGPRGAFLFAPAEVARVKAETLQQPERAAGMTTTEAQVQTR